MQIESLAAGGDAVAHLPDGRVLFVPFAAPGDRMRVRVVESHARFARGVSLALVSAGPARCEPRCPVFGTCGGCAWQHLRYADQLAAKRRIVRDALVRVGGQDAREITITPSPNAYGYRSRARVLQRGNALGYRERRSHRLCAATACPALAPPLERALERLAASVAAQPAGRELDEQEWELALGDGDAIRVCPVGADTATERAALELSVGDEHLQASAGVFSQSNGLLHRELAQAVHRAALCADPPGRAGVALELFAGIGFLTLGLARRFERVVAVESERAALRDLRDNLTRAEIANVEIRAERVEDALPLLSALHPDVVVLDPPRTGLAPGSAELLAALGARSIVYLSCDPATLARDVSILCSSEATPGYRLQAVEAFDLFPQTPHVETLATLQRRPDSPDAG